MRCGFLPAALQDAKSDDNELATDNALSALAALLEHHSDVLDAAQVRGCCEKFWRVSATSSR
jgi:hypothetical protein